MAKYKHKTLAFFIPHRGCPHQCSFCDQTSISGITHAPVPQEVAAACKEMLLRYGGTLENAEVAFFGGSFTAVEPSYRQALLESVQPYLGKGKFSGIRISTRPDAIDSAILTQLQRYHVTAIELGAQSMCDAVLQKNERGHDAQSVRNASSAIRKSGFSLGLQQMVGLYGSTLADEYSTLEQLLACQPDTIRIYPTVILKGTKLAQYYAKGDYLLLPKEKVLEYCADALCRCAEMGVRVIRLGLHDAPSLREKMLDGYYHPAYRELVESRLYLRALERAAKENKISELFVETALGTMSKVLGQHGINRKRLAECAITMKVMETMKVASGEIVVCGKQYPIYGFNHSRDMC